MLTLDPVTMAVYRVLTAAADRAAAVRDMFVGTVYVGVYDGNDQLMGAGQMALPWAALGAPLEDGRVPVVVGEFDNFTVLISGVPDPDSWYLLLTDSRDRYLRGRFGFAGADDADFTWSLASWSAGQQGTIGAVACYAEDVPIVFGWLNASTPQAIGVTVGGAGYDASQDLVVPEGVVPEFSLTAPVAGVAVNAETGVITSSVEYANQLIEVEAWDGEADASDALEDWIARSTHPDVVWAQRFGPTDAGADYWLRQGETSAAVARRLSTDGIIGDGCLEIFVPAGNTPGRAGWGRPLAPVQAHAPYGIVADTNPKGLPTLPMHAFYSFNGNEGFKKLSNMRGGVFTNAAYFNSSTYSYGGHSIREYAWSGGFWLQYRMKVSASHLMADEHAGKLWILDHNSGATDQGEIVMGVWGASRPNGPAVPYFYTAQGTRPLTSGQNAVPGELDFPGGNYPLCTWGAEQTANCYNLPADQWITMNIGVFPGTQNVPPSTANKDARVVVRVAAQGATQWTTLIDKPNFHWWYNAFFQNDPANLPWANEQCPFGFNEFRLTLYNGGGDQTAVLRDMYTRFDQIICSTSEPALPA